ncbi:hypothetical protein RV14_GL000624 [Enterococcus ratti]|uniref:Uncharacterized protein n=1 Tax=Enterococcus ratti TaxID=150033 RepID=A0A1L8WGU0_9ENTE|nr:hypothetical protein RV14_GL000624 [Enterococcus ratti]
MTGRARLILLKKFFYSFRLEKMWTNESYAFLFEFNHLFEH